MKCSSGFDFCLTFIRPASNECRAKVEQKLDEVFKRFSLLRDIHSTSVERCREKVEQKLDEVFKRFWLLPDIHSTSVERMSSKSRTKVGWSVQTVWLLPDIHSTSVERMSSKSRTKVGWSVQAVFTFARHSFDQRRTNVGQKSNKSWIRCSNGFDTTQRFQNKGKVEWRSGKRLIQFNFHSTSASSALLTKSFKRTQHSFDKIVEWKVGQKLKPFPWTGLQDNLLFCNLSFSFCFRKLVAVTLFSLFAQILPKNSLQEHPFFLARGHSLSRFAFFSRHTFFLSKEKDCLLSLVVYYSVFSSEVTVYHQPQRRYLHRVNCNSYPLSGEKLHG